MNSPAVILDDAQSGQMRVFSRPASVVSAQRPEEVEDAFVRIEAALAAGKHVAGYFSYELGYLLELRLKPLLPSVGPGPLLWFGVFEASQQYEAEAYLAQHVRGRAYAGPLRHEWSAKDYAARFRKAHRLIEAGDIYQANLSFRSQFAFAGDPLALYRDLRTRSGAPHCAFIDDGERRILSLSPELFFSVSAGGRILAKPMKGTAPRGDTPALDAEARARLRASEKDRAENLMIVDLLRNDIGRIAKTGSVAVEELFAVESYPTVHQMVSTIRAQRKRGVRAREIVQALFPCGSVTGAPKIRAMEIIAELESSPRGVYCGGIGYFAPDGSASFNVAIRTMTIGEGCGELGIGGAVVYDSYVGPEYAECLLKARYFELARPSLGLIETLRWSATEGFVCLERHLARMASSAAALGFLFDNDAANAALIAAVAKDESPLRVRLTLTEDGAFHCTASPLPLSKAEWRYRISTQRVWSGDALLRHKTTRRELFDSDHAAAAGCGYDEVLFLNERGELTEGSRTNLFARIQGELVTPPLACGLLGGCLRAHLLDTGQCRERALVPHDLEIAEEVWLGNSLRGLIRAVA